jgi:hypothetical protein
MTWLNDVLNYFTYLRVIKKASKTEHWKNLKLKLDWLGRVWFIMNLRTDDLGDPDVVKNAKIVQRLRTYHKYFEEDLELAEIISISVSQKTQQSFLVVYYPLFRPNFIWRFLRSFLLLSLGIFLFLFFDVWLLILKLYNGE